MKSVLPTKLLSEYLLTLTTGVFLIVILTTSDFGKLQARFKPPKPLLAWYTEHGRDGLLPWVTHRSKISCEILNVSVSCDIGRASVHNKADGYLFYATFLKELPFPRQTKTLWGLIHEESPRNLPGIVTEEVLNLFNFSSTFSRYSDVPMPLLWMSLENITNLDYFVQTERKNAMLSEIAPVLYLQSHCETFTERDRYVQELMKLIPVDSFGKCLKNKQFPKHLAHFENSDGKDYLVHIYDHEVLKFIAKYKFVIAIENAVCEDYVTEKLWRAVSLGVVPIYFGSPMVKDWFPNNKSAILLQDYPTPALMSQHLRRLLKNDSEYEEYLEHKTKGLISNQRIFKEMEARPYQNNLLASIDKLYCIMCERLHMKNSSRVDIVTKKHYNCSLNSALTLKGNPENAWIKKVEDSKKNIVDQMFSRGVARN